MDKSKLKDIKNSFIDNDTKLVEAFNKGSEIYGASIERQLHFLQTRVLLSSSILARLLETLTEEINDGQIEKQTD